MKKTRLFREAAINKFIGSYYYEKKILPRIKENGQDWKEAWKPKKACLILSFDPDETKDIFAIPGLLIWLKKYKIRASFAAIGMLVERHPKVFKQIVKEGHELINHTYSHPDNRELNPDNHFHKLPKRTQFWEIKKCHDVVKKILKYNMKGFRIPHFGNQYTTDIYPMLEKLGYKFSTSTMASRTKNGGFPYKVGKIREYPIVCSPVYPFCIFDTSHAFRSRYFKQTPIEFLKNFKKLLNDGIKNGMFINLYQDPQDLHKFDYEEMLSIVENRRKELLITTYEQLTRRIK